MTSGRGWLLAALLLWAVTLALAWPGLPFEVVDNDFYRRMATGAGDGVPMPFAGRLGHPWLAGLIAGATGLELDTAFTLLMVPLLAGFCLCLGWWWRDQELAPGLWLAAALASPALLVLARGVYLPDLSHAAGLALAFVALRAGKAWLAALIVLALFAVRESTIVVAGACLLAALVQRDRNAMLLWAATGIAGLALAQALAAGASNVHGLPGFVYLAAKLPVNWAHNLLGLTFFTSAEQYCYPPLASRELPLSLQFGNVTALGLCPWAPANPLVWASIAATHFGVLPALLLALLLALWRREGRALFRGLPFWLLAALIYGTLMWLLAPGAGKSMLRLMGYAWPLFWLAAPALAAMKGQLQASGRFGHPRWLVAHLVALWAPFALRPFAEPSELDPAVAGLSLAVGLAANAWAFRLWRAARLSRP